MKTVADLKRRLQVGTSLTLTFFGGNQSKQLGKTRVISKVNSGGVFIGDEGSYLDFPKKNELTWKDENTFQINFNDCGFTLEYRIGK